MLHPFEVGKSYRNRSGEYVVQAIDGERMTIRYAAGGTLETRVDLQARIWENIQFEEEMAREDERVRLAKEERLEARRRAAQAKAEAAIPRFKGFRESDFETKKRGIAWSSRVELGKALAYKLNALSGARKEEGFGQWIVPRQSGVHVARTAHFDREHRDTNAVFFVAVNEQGVTYGFCVGKPRGKEKAKWPWSALVAALAGDAKFRRTLRAAMRKHELSLDVYAEEASYGQVGHITVQQRGFLWEHETAEQAMTQTMTWGKVVEYLQTVAPKKRCDLYLRKSTASDEAIESGAAMAGEIAELFQALLPVYDVSEGV